MSFVVDIIDGKLQNDGDFYSLINGVGDTSSFIAQVGDLKVTQSVTPGANVLVSTGRAYLYVGSKTSYFGATLNAATTLSIGANSSGSTRIDIICVKFDTATTSNSAGDNIVSLQVVAGTPGAGVPATPANYYKLAEVSVATGFPTSPSTIVNANITDKRNFLTITEGATQFFQIATPSNPASGANKVYFKTDGNMYKLNSSGTESTIAMILQDTTHGYIEQFGSVNVTLSSATTSNASVTFPTAFATALSNVVLSVGGTTTNGVSKYVVANFSRSTAGFNVEVSYWPNTSTSDTVTVNWRAIGY